jgi:hypothetical protein
MNLHSWIRSLFVPLLYYILHALLVSHHKDAAL